MLKQLICAILFICIIVVFSVGLCETFTVEDKNPYGEQALDLLSIDELLELKAKISDVLTYKGYVLYRDLSHGDKNDDVLNLQNKLKELGFFTSNVNGKYDGATEKAVKAFQKANGLTASGVATQETQVLLYSGENIEKVTPTPKPTAVPTPTLDPKYSEYIELDYRDCARYPEKHKGEKVRIDGTVAQVIGSRWLGFSIRLQISGSNDVVYVNIMDNLDYNILDDDRVTVYATMNGLETYTAIFGTSVTIPKANADYIIIK